MIEPLLLTIAVVTVPFGLYLAFDRKKTDHRLQKRINRHERTRQALQRLSQQEEHWNLGHLRFELRQNYRSIQKLRLAGDWDGLLANVSSGPLQEWRQEWERRERAGVRWVLDPLEIVDVQPVNLQNRPGFEKDFVTVEVETRRRDFVRGPEGCFQEGSGAMGETPDHIPIELYKEYWTFNRRADGWTLVRTDRTFPENLAFIEDEEPAVAI
ncbi:TIM44-like domain-containing protein [bacterium]|nr:TIM44-like domain-containing protein [bacterium]